MTWTLPNENEIEAELEIADKVARKLRTGSAVQPLTYSRLFWALRQAEAVGGKRPKAVLLIHPESLYEYISKLHPLSRLSTEHPDFPGVNSYAFSGAALVGDTSVPPGEIRWR